MMAGTMKEYKMWVWYQISAVDPLEVVVNRELLDGWDIKSIHHEGSGSYHSIYYHFTRDIRPKCTEDSYRSPGKYVFIGADRSMELRKDCVYSVGLEKYHRGFRAKFLVEGNTRTCPYDSIEAFDRNWRKL